jgi:hypothetical protein
MGWSERIGPRWGREEVSAFFKLLRQHQSFPASSSVSGKFIDEILVAVPMVLPNRTPEMVRALFHMHKAYVPHTIITTHERR